MHISIEENEGLCALSMDVSDRSKDLLFTFREGGSFFGRKLVLKSWLMPKPIMYSLKTLGEPAEMGEKRNSLGKVVR